MKQGFFTSLLLMMKQLTYRLFLKYSCFREHLVILMGINMRKKSLRFAGKQLQQTGLH